MQPGWRAALGVLALAVAWGGCSGPSPLDSPDAGRAAAYEPGVPHFDVEVVPDIERGEPGLHVYVSLPRAALVFARTDTAFAARYDLAVRIRDERGRGTEAFEVRSDTLLVTDVDATRSAERERRALWFPLAPGRYVAEVTVEDRNTDEVGERRQRVEVRGEGAPAWVGRPLLFGEDDLPVTALHVPADAGPLELRTEWYGTPPGAAVEAALLRLEADTSVAYPPFWLSPSRASLTFRGVSDDIADTVLVRREAVGPGDGALAVPLPPLDPGIFQFELALRWADGAVLASERRMISVKPPGFPRITTLDGLIDALAYIAYPREQAHIREGFTPQERRARFDAFWGALVPERQAAANLLRQYYERVEEANRLFTSHKEGWKTDRGMIYVVFGAPAYVERTFEGEVWHYAVAEQDPSGRFVFERPFAHDRADPFGHLVLVRQPIYERPWTRALERWRRGEML